MSHAILRGRDHKLVGPVDVISEGPSAIAITRGGATKRYQHLDENEDAAGFWRGPSGTVLAVADGHNGFEAAEVAVESVLRDPAPQWAEPGGVDADQWPRQAIAALCDANRTILAERGGVDELPSRSTLVVGVVQPKTNMLLYACCGDSLLFLVEDETVRLISQQGPLESFLGFADREPEALRKFVQIGAVSLDGVAAVVAVTDGLTEDGIGVEDPQRTIFAAADRAVEAAPALRASVLARLIAEAANEAHLRRGSGDNVAVAVHWVV